MITTGCIGILWSIAALFLIYDTPLVHPRISAEEKHYLLNSQKKVEVSALLQIIFFMANRLMIF